MCIENLCVNEPKTPKIIISNRMVDIALDRKTQA